MSRQSSAGSTVPKAARAERSWWLQGSFCSHFRLLNTSQLQVMLKATQEISCLPDVLACLEHDQGAQLTAYAAVNGM